MKILVRSLSAAVILIALSLNVNAQASETATATATIIEPITLTNVTDMNFGNIAVSAAGTVVLSPAGVRTPTGGITLPTITGTVSAATFDVDGEANFTYSITLPAAAITITNGTDNLTVDTWTSNPTPTGTLDGTGYQLLQVGATLDIPLGTESAGTYTGPSFTVTVNYN